MALVSDIQQAYLNVEINEEDRDFLRFLWINNVDYENPKVITYRFTRVLFGMGPSQFLLAAVILKHFDKCWYDPSGGGGGGGGVVRKKFTEPAVKIFLGPFATPTHPFLH